jgi:hypothetical protein
MLFVLGWWQRRLDRDETNPPPMTEISLERVLAFVRDDISPCPLEMIDFISRYQIEYTCVALNSFDHESVWGQGDWWLTRFCIDIPNESNALIFKMQWTDAIIESR